MDQVSHATRLWLLTLVLIAGCLPSSAVDKGYAVADIPEGLTAGADAVVRVDDIAYTIESRSKGSVRRRYAVTILNAKGKRHARLVLGYDRLTKIPSLTALTFDGDGKQIRKLKASEIGDVAAQDGFSLYSDDRLKVVDMTHTSYPYTVEFVYTIDYKYLYGIPGISLGNENLSIQQASYRLTYPRDLAPRYRLINCSADPVRSQPDGSTETLTWSFAGIKPIQLEPHGPHPEEVLPRIIAAPSLFEYDGYPGDMSTWKSYGQWFAEINRGRDQLSEATRTKVKELTAGLTTTEEKARALYVYLQNKTRYVSIQLGIGGLQTFPANTVEQTGYGDCKALSNFMIALLKEAGIRGHYTTIQAGQSEAEIITDFPSHQSNHIIVAVPDGRDTLWLECTSQTQPFGYLGRFTGDRFALMITDAGGSLVRTPAYTKDQNTQFRSADVQIDLAGNAKARVRTTYSGTQTENGGLLEAANSQADQQRKWIEEDTDIPSFNLGSFSMQAAKSKIPAVVVNVQLELNRYASVSGKRLFLQPNLMNRSTYVPEKVTTRQSPVVRYFGYTDVDTIRISMPEALYPEFVPKPMKVTSPFGEYEATVSFENGKVTYIRKMTMRNGRFPKESYSELVEFYKNVNRFDNLKLVLLSRT